MIGFSYPRADLVLAPLDEALVFCLCMGTLGDCFVLPK